MKCSFTKKRNVGFPINQPALLTPRLFASHHHPSSITPHYSSLTPHCSPLITRPSSFTPHQSPFTPNPLITYPSSQILHNHPSSLISHPSLLTSHHSPLNPHCCLETSVADPRLLLCGSGSTIQKKSIWIRILGDKD